MNTEKGCIPYSIDVINISLDCTPKKFQQAFSKYWSKYKKDLEIPKVTKVITQFLKNNATDCTKLSTSILSRLSQAIVAKCNVDGRHIETKSTYIRVNGVYYYFATTPYSYKLMLKNTIADLTKEAKDIEKILDERNLLLNKLSVAYRLHQSLMETFKESMKTPMVTLNEQEALSIVDMARTNMQYADAKRFYEPEMRSIFLKEK